MKRLVALAVVLAAAGGLSASEPVEPARPNIDELRAASAAKPEDPQARRDLALALQSANRLDEAIVQFEWLAKRSPNVRSLLELAIAYRSASRLADSEATYKRLLEISPDNPVALHNLGSLAFKQGDADKAIAYFRKALEIKPDYLLAHAHLGDMLRQVERNEEAYREYEKVLELEPTNGTELAAFDDALYRMATLDMQNGAYQRAGQLLAELLRANPEHQSAYYALGQVLLHLDRPEEAQKAFEAHQRILAKQTPTSPMAHPGE